MSISIGILRHFLGRTGIEHVVTICVTADIMVVIV